MGGNFRYMLKIFRDFGCLTFYLCTDLNASLNLKLLAFWFTRSKSGHKKGGWPHFRSWWYLQMANMLSLGCDQVVFQFRYPARSPKNDCQIMKKANFCQKNTKKCHFRSQGGLGVKTTHVVRLTPIRTTKHQKGAGTLNPRLHAQNCLFRKFGG